MTTASQAFAVIRSVIEGDPPEDGATWGSAAVQLLWYGDPNQIIPDFPAPFGFTLFEAGVSGVIERGGGSGQLRHRNPAAAEFFVCTPKDSGQQRGTDIAEQVAALFRSYNESGVTVENATVYPSVDGSQLKPPGADTDVGNYLVAACGIEFRFDLIG